MMKFYLYFFLFCAIFCCAWLIGLLLSVGAFAQITVNGNVKDATGEAVIGATVRIIGQDGGTVTDFEGNFVIKCDEGADLQISSGKRKN